MLSGGDYYALFGASASGPSQVAVSYLSVTQSQLSSTYISVILGGASVLLMISGIIIAIVSLFLKPKDGAAREQAVTKADEAAKKEYAELEKRQKAKPKAKRKDSG